MLIIFAALNGAHAITLTVLHSFAGGTDGANPEAGVVRDSAGNLYGSTSGGGAHDYGTVFKVATNGKEIVMHAFAGIGDGAVPNGVHLDGLGDIYGSTLSGLQNASNGTVFKIAPDRTMTVLYTFPGGHYGSGPSGILMGLTGTTQSGGLYNEGTVYKVSSKGAEAVLYSFRFNQTDGRQPVSGVIGDGADNLYGTTESGGTSGRGTVFKLAPDGTEMVLYSFCPKINPCPDGEIPQAGLKIDSAGNLYGTTVFGGNGAGNNGGGTLFKVATDSTETVLYSFCTRANCSDGSWPGPITLNSAGDIYGVTRFGGINCDAGHQGCGTVFKFVNGVAKVLYNFTGSDGAHPMGALLLGGAGILYGTTNSGGANGLGTVFKLNLK